MRSAQVSELKERLDEVIEAEITRRWSAIGAPEAVERAIDLLSRHPLRAADSVQLASALIARERFGSLPFVTLDKDLAIAARAEGFTVLP
jgi:predicted nucleic acid-binding protein